MCILCCYKKRNICKVTRKYPKASTTLLVKDALDTHS